MAKAGRFPFAIVEEGIRTNTLLYHLHSDTINFKSNGPDNNIMDYVPDEHDVYVKEEMHNASISRPV